MATASPFLLCDPCKDSGKNQVAVAFCLKCRQLYCESCFDYHRKLNATKSHQYVNLTGEKKEQSFPCECCHNNLTSAFCTDCRELYCAVGTNFHVKFTATKSHVILNLNDHQPNSKITEIVSGVADLEFDVTYSGAQVPIKKKGQEEQVGTTKDRVTTKTPDCTSNKRTDRVTAKTPDRTSNKRTDRVTAKAPDRTSNKRTDRVTAKAPDRTSNKRTNISDTHQNDNVASPAVVKQTSLFAKRFRRFSVREISDKEYVNITRIISMPDGRLVAIGYSPNFIKLYSANYELRDELCTGICDALAYVDYATVAVVVLSLRYYSLKGNKIRYSGKELNIVGRVRDIAYRRGEFITRYAKDNMDYTSHGSKLIVKQNRELTRDDFMYYDSVYDCVILSNHKEETVASYVMNGTENWKIKITGGPHGIAVVNGIILVAVHNAKTIRQITMDGRLLPTPLLTEDNGILYHPYAITYQPVSHRLLVSKFNDAAVVVFNLSS